MNNKFIEILKRGGIGILPTDTLYALVGSAPSKGAVERIYRLRKRESKKPLIILISSLKDLNLFDIKISNQLRKNLNNIWPGKISVILSCPLKKWSYLHRGIKTIAFRLPAKKRLIDILKKTGPLVAPSANISGMPPAKNVLEAKKYFGNKVDFYISAGKVVSGPSTLIEINNGIIKIIRKGVVKISIKNIK